MSINYKNIIAGTVVATKNHEQVAWAQACAALDSENILILVDEQDFRAEYLALPSSAAVNGLVFSPLAAAMPSHPEHKGDGIYLHEVPGALAAVVRGPNRFEALYNTIPAMQAWLAEPSQARLPRHDTSACQPQELRPLKLRQSQDGREVMGKITALNFWGALLAVALAVSGAVGVTVYRTTQGHDDSASELRVSELAAQEVTRYSTRLFELSRVATLVVRTGGWLEKYNLKGDAVVYEARVPQWVTSEVIKELGVVQTEKDYVKDMVIIKHGVVTP